jgi:parallel beta-helix repeat protein
VVVSPGDDLQAMIDSRAAGAKFWLEAGTHRLGDIEPKPGNEFQGASGAIMSGAKVISGATRVDGLWRFTGRTEQGTRRGECESGNTTCTYPEQLFINGTRLTQVGSKSAVTPGKWYFDYGADQIWMADDPTGATIELSYQPHAFTGGVDDVTIKNLVMEKYATPNREAVVNPRDGYQGAPGYGWVVTDNVIRYNHGIGLKVESGMVVRSNHVHHHGQMGVVGSGEGVVMENNEISYNTTSGFRAFQGSMGAGGVTFTHTTDLVLRNNYVHHNYGHALHVDIESIGALYEGNLVTDNLGVGIHHETSYQATIRNNVVKRNGFAPQVSYHMAGILVLTSSDVEVYGNELVDNGHGIEGRQDHRAGQSGAHGTLRLRNLRVHDNYIENHRGRSGVIAENGDPAAYSTSVFDYNTYKLHGIPDPYRWNNDILTVSEWRAAGNDPNSTWL